MRAGFAQAFGINCQLNRGHDWADDPGRHRHRWHVHRRGRLRPGHRPADDDQDRLHAEQPGGWLPGRHRQGAGPARRGARRSRAGARLGQPRHHGGHQPVARGQGRPTSASSPPRATSSCWRSLGSRFRTVTATATSGSSRTRIVPVHRVRTVGGRLDYTGAEVRPFDEAAGDRDRRVLQGEGIATIGVCLLHSYANPEHERRMRDGPGARPPRRGRVDLVRGAARVPRVRAVDDHPGRRRGQAEGGRATSDPSRPGWTALADSRPARST